jgi:hypothetical protein
MRTLDAWNGCHGARKKRIMVKREQLDATMYCDSCKHQAYVPDMLMNERDSDAISASLNRPVSRQLAVPARRPLESRGRHRVAPGMIYVKLRRPDSICDTALAFLTMKSAYMSSHFGGKARVSGKPFRACLYSDDIVSRANVVRYGDKLGVQVWEGG